MKNIKINNLLVILLIIIVSFFGIFEVLYFLNNSSINKNLPSNAKSVFTMNIAFVDNNGTVVDESKCIIIDEIGTISNNSTCSFYVERQSIGEYVSFYEDPKYNTEWNNKSSEYYEISYELYLNKLEKSNKNIDEITLKPQIKKTNTTGSEIEENVYIKINGMKYKEE